MGKFFQADRSLLFKLYLIDLKWKCESNGIFYLDGWDESVFSFSLEFMCWDGFSYFLQ